VSGDDLVLGAAALSFILVIVLATIWVIRNYASPPREMVPGDLVACLLDAPWGLGNGDHCTVTVRGVAFWVFSAGRGRLTAWPMWDGETPDEGLGIQVRAGRDFYHTAAGYVASYGPKGRA
jgi:hypothetical protein